MLISDFYLQLMKSCCNSLGWLHFFDGDVPICQLLFYYKCIRVSVTLSLARK